MDYWNHRGLLNSARKLPDIVDENCPLYTLEYYLLAKRAGVYHASSTHWLNSYINKLYNGLGFYDNIVGVKTGGDAYTSHDQLRTICVYSKLHGHHYHRLIWDKLKACWFTYDNLKGIQNIQRLVHPRDIIFIGSLNNNLLCNLLMPIYYFFAFITFAGSHKVRPTLWDSIKHFVSFRTWPLRYGVAKTDGELLYWVESHVTASGFCKRLLNRYANYRAAKRFGGWDKLFRTYFRDSEHPVNIAVGNLSLNDLKIK